MAEAVAPPMITVSLPARLRPYADGAGMLTITAPVNTIAELVASLERTAPRLMRQLETSAFSFVVNGQVLPRDERRHPLKPGDRVDIERTASGDVAPLPSRGA